MKRKELQNVQVGLRMTRELKDKIIKAAEAEGFDSYQTWMKWILRREVKKNERSVGRIGSRVYS